MSLLDKQEVQDICEHMHCTLENGADLYVNERHKIRHYRARSTEERRRRKKDKEECQIAIFYFAQCVRKLRYIAMLYIHSIGNQPYNMIVVFKMRGVVPSVRYSIVCNVCVYGASRSSLLIESTDYDMHYFIYSFISVTSILYTLIL